MNKGFVRSIAAGGIALSVIAASASDGGGGYPAALRWIWYPEGQPGKSAPVGTRYFRAAVELPSTATVAAAQLIVNADDGCSPFVNGTRLPEKGNGWMDFKTYDVTRLLKPGRNVLAVEAENGASAAGFIGWLAVRIGKEKQVLAVTDGTWKSSDTFKPKWEQPGHDDSAWKPAMVLGPVTMAPWNAKMKYVREPMMTLTRRQGDKPVTPEQAQALIEEDWIFQAGDSTTALRALSEIGWARETAARLAAQPGAPDFSADLASLAALEKRLAALRPEQEDDATRELYLAVRRIKRAIMVRNPLLNFDRVLLVDTPSYAGRHESAHRNGYQYGAAVGSRLLSLEGLRPDGVERELVSGTEGYIMRMDLAFDASKVVFSLKPKGERSFHLYEIGIVG